MQTPPPEPPEEITIRISTKAWRYQLATVPVSELPEPESNEDPGAYEARVHEWFDDFQVSNYEQVEAWCGEVEDGDCEHTEFEIEDPEELETLIPTHYEPDFQI